MEYRFFIILLLFSPVLGVGSFNKLVKAIKNNKVEAFQSELEAGVDVNKTTWGVTPLYIAVHFNRPQMIKPLLEYGADINALAGSKKRTALHKAVSKNNEEIVRILVDNGADRSIVNKKGKTSLQEAEEHGNEVILEALKPL
jgi:uncharacterized protein